MTPDLHQRVLAFVYYRTTVEPTVHVPNAEIAAALGVSEETIRGVRVAFLADGLIARIFGGFTLTPQGLKAAKLAAV